MPQTLTSLIEAIVDTALSVRGIELTGTHTVTIGTAFFCDATSGAFTVTLPTAGTLSNDESRVLIFVKIDSSVNNVTISRSGSDTINGATTFALTAQYKYLILIDTESGGIWLNIGSN